MDDPYRKPGAPALQEQPPSDGVEYVAGGRLVHDPKYHCKPPGWWARLWHHVQDRDKWICTCGAEWMWRTERYDDSDAWVCTNREGFHDRR